MTAVADVITSEPGAEALSRARNPSQPSQDELSELRTPRLHRWLGGLFSDWAVIVLALVAARSIDHLAAYALAVFVIGTRQHALGILGHDGAHRLGTQNRWLNDSLTQVFIFWPVFAELRGYRRFHWTHHQHTNTAKDPELAYRSLGAPEWDVPTAALHIGFRFFKDLVGLGAVESLRVLYAIRPNRWQHYIGLAVFWLTVFLVTAVTGTLWILALWFLALFTSFAAVWRLRCWMEHIGSDDTHRVALPGWMAWIVSPHNVWAHWEHHKWPGIPYWNLPKARALDSSVPVTTFAELLRYWTQCSVVKTGAPTRDETGGSLLADAS